MKHFEQMRVRAFYGFAPEHAGYIGFTKQADQETKFRQLKENDIVLIYGAHEKTNFLSRTRKKLKRTLSIFVSNMHL